jgi:hypothetical protein
VRLLGHSPVLGDASREAAAPAPESGQVPLPCHALHLLSLLLVRFQLHQVVTQIINLILTLEAGVVTSKVQKFSNKNINVLKQGQKLDTEV